MTRVQAVSAGFGVIFGFLLSWGQLTSPDVIMGMLRLESAYVFLVMGSGIAVGATGIRLLRRARFRAVLTGELVSWSTARPQPRHVVGSMLFGLGWALSDACPGPVAAQLGQGLGWSLFTAAGVVGGVLLYLWREEPTGERRTGGLTYASAPE
jgi:uncharacterized membrane protein YedE/YeeE